VAPVTQTPVTQTAVTQTSVTQTSEVGSSEATAWDQGRWATILDRMEHRQPGVGLRFWGPPLWLEVTMTGPDSDAWSTASGDGGDDQSWDWQAEEACHGVAALLAAGAGDEDLLALVSRYTLENLVLNATHEVGEWLRFDTRRIFAAHLSDDDTGARLLGPGRQGNGAVQVTVAFGPPVATPMVSTADHPDQAGAATAGVEVARRAAAVAAGWRFTFLPGTEIVLGPGGPAVSGAWSWGPAGSPRTVATLGGDDAAFVACVQRDVHRLLIRAEVHRICNAFHVDGRTPWYLGPDDDRERRAGSPEPEAAQGTTGAGRQPVSVGLETLG
jgi:hypothetical protein